MSRIGFSGVTMLKKKISLDKGGKYKYFKGSVYCQTFYNDLKKKKGLNRLVKKFNVIIFFLY